MPFLIIFFIIPMAEVYAFMTVGGEIGVLKTLLLCVATAILGGFLVRLQGLETLMKAQNNLRTGKMPINEIFSGFCIVIAGALLLTPGFVTDISGFLLLFPPFRAVLQSFLSKNVNFNVHTGQNRQNHPGNSHNSDDGVIEGVYEQVEKDNPALDKQSKPD